MCNGHFGFSNIIFSEQNLSLQVGFVDIVSRDATDWYRVKAREEYDLMKGELYPRMVELLGQGDADHFVENWRAMVIVIDSGEMRQGYSRGRRPE